MVQLQMIVGVDETRHDERAVEIDDEIVRSRLCIDVKDARGKPDRRGAAVGQHDPRVHERDRPHPVQHGLRTLTA
jgi:hypothetical protein